MKNSTLEKAIEITTSTCVIFGGILAVAASLALMVCLPFLFIRTASTTESMEELAFAAGVAR